MPDPELTAAEQEACEDALKRIGECVRRRGTVLDLSGLGLTCLPPKIVQLAKLAELDLSHNRLATLPAELLQLPQLARLDLSHNPMAALAPEIGQLAGLTALDLSNTQLTTLPGELGQLANLTRLELSHTALATLPPELGQLTKLNRLYLTHTPLTTLPPELGQLAKLTRLFLSHNRLASLPPELGALASLTRLDLSHNRLTALPPELGGLDKLTVLELTANLLDSLPPELGQLSRLTVLSLAANRLCELPDTLRTMAGLETLLLHDNPGLQLSPSVLGADPRLTDMPAATPLRAASAKSILEFYFARRMGETRPLNAVKLLVVGRSGAGKTSMLNALRDLPFREREESTAGIALSEWTLDGGEEAPVTVQAWDFSGHPPTHVLHPFFFSRRSLYVLVLTGRDRHEREDAESWLRLIQARGTDELGQGPPVLVALNQWNVPGCRPEVDRTALRERFPFIRGFVEMDCKVKKGIPVMKAALNRELERMPWVREPFPDAWHAVRRALPTGAAHLTQDEYRALCREHGVTDEGQQDYLAETLHHLGTALDFRHHDRRHEAALWQPAWLTKHLYPLLHRAHQQAGIIRPADLDTMLHPVPDGPLRTHLLGLMERGGLAVPLQSKTGEGWLIPGALPSAPPPGLEPFENAPDTTRLRFTYPELPPDGVIRICQRRFDFIEETRDHPALWRSGVVLARKGARALIREVPPDRQLLITVSGPRPVRLQLADLCQAEMLEIHATIPDLAAIAEIRIQGEWVPVAPPESGPVTPQSEHPTRSPG